MTIDAVAEVTIARPRDEVAAFAADPERMPLWRRGLKWIEWQGEPGLRVGAALTVVSALRGGRQREVPWEVVTCEPGARLVMRTTGAGPARELSCEWRDAGADRTHMIFRQREALATLAMLVAPLRRLAMQRAAGRELMLLKSILEMRSRRRPGT